MENGDLKFINGRIHHYLNGTWYQVPMISVGGGKKTTVINNLSSSGNDIFVSQVTASMIPGDSVFSTFFREVNTYPTIEEAKLPVPINGTLKNIYIYYTDTNPTATTGSTEFQIYKNGIATGFIINIPYNQPNPSTITDLVQNVPFVAGDFISFRVKNNTDQNLFIRLNISCQYQS